MTLLVTVIALALMFDVINGFHDAANSIATVVSTKVLTPFQAVLWAALFNYIAVHIMPFKVAGAVADNIVHQDAVNLIVVAAGVSAAIIWNLITWWAGIPSSSSHTLMGGVAGAAIAKGGWIALKTASVLKIMAFIVLAPVIGMIIAFFLSVLLTFICKGFSPRKVDKSFRRLQLLSAASYSLGHGANDAQKVMGIIWLALISSGNVVQGTKLNFGTGHDWVIYSCQIAMALGTLMGGWRIVKTMGTRITKLRPFEGFAAESAGAITLFTTAQLGIPVSTTQTITGSIIGVGAVKRISAVRWGVTINIIWAWILTIPITGLLAVALFHLFNLFA